MTYSKSREIDDKARELIAQGWSAFRGARHFRLVHPTSGYTLTVPGTPGDRRSVQNWFSQIRRAERVGFDPRVIFGGRDR